MRNPVKKEEEEAEKEEEKEEERRKTNKKANRSRRITLRLSLIATRQFPEKCPPHTYEHKRARPHPTSTHICSVFYRMTCLKVSEIQTLQLKLKSGQKLKSQNPDKLCV